MNAVLTNAKTLLIIIRVQSIALCQYVNSLPKSFKWNPHGRMMQMVKHAIAPIRDIIRSKSGTRIANTTNKTVQRRRTVTFRQPLVKPDMPVMEASSASALASRPSEISIVLTIGLDVSEVAGGEVPTCFRVNFRKYVDHGSGICCGVVCIVKRGASEELVAVAQRLLEAPPSCVPSPRPTKVDYLGGRSRLQQAAPRQFLR